MTEINQWDSVGGLLTERDSWLPPEDQTRVAAYLKYDQIYWNEEGQFELRVLEGEEPLYIPNARVIVDTTAHYLAKGLSIDSVNGEVNLAKALDDFLKREEFYSRFNIAKHAGVARGDYFFHLTANPTKQAGTRLSLTSLSPAAVFPTYDADSPERMIECHIAEEVEGEGENSREVYIHRLTYTLVEHNGERRVARAEGLYERDNWYNSDAVLVRGILPPELLPSPISVIPVYGLKNRAWDGERWGSSELRGLESIFRSVSQGDTDVSAALSLEGLGVYATDGGRPVDDLGNEVDWSVAPGRVMEVTAGAYFKRVDGIKSIAPSIEQVRYLEAKLQEASATTDVALGKVDVRVAESGIALAIQFQPTLAKIETRDLHIVSKLTQLFYDWKIWHGVYEGEFFSGEIVPTLGSKLPLNRTERLNELNNMLDRKIVSRQYYREEMAKLGYEFPEDIQEQVYEEIKELAEITMWQQNLDEEEKEDTEEDTVPRGNQSNNANFTNESNGTEATQTLEEQAHP